MAGIFRRAGRNVWVCKVPDLRRKGIWEDRSTTTSDRVTATKMQDAINEVAAVHPPAFDILERLLDKRMSVAEWFAAWVASGEDLEAMRERLNDVDLEPYVEKFFRSMKGKVAEDTRAHYLSALRTMFPAGKAFPRSTLTRDGIQEWVDAKLEAEVAAGTIRKHAAGLHRFVGWLELKHVLRVDVMRLVELPSPAAARINFLETDEAIRLADAQESPYRELSALLAGTSLDVSTAIGSAEAKLPGLRVRDVYVARKQIRAAGTKTHQRDRVVRVADWAWPYVLELLEGKLPDARLFDGIPDRWVAGDNHRAAVASLVKLGFPVFAGYWMRDARHTWAVRAMRAGVPLEVMRRQMGHVDAKLILDTYGLFAPHADELDKWEEVSSAADVARNPNLQLVRKLG